MLTRLAIKNFKSIGDPGIDLELKPLTFLVGPNGSGKSVILEALALASQRCNLKGPLVNYSSLDEVIHKREPNRLVSIEANFLPLEVVKLGGRQVKNVGCRYFFEEGGGPFSFQRLIDGVAIPSLSHEDVRLFEDEVRRWSGMSYFLQTVRGTNAGPIEAGEHTGVDPFGEYAIPILNLLNKGENQERKHKVQEWAKKFGMRDLSGFAEAGNMDADYEDITLNTILPFRSTSYGSRQVSTIIILLFWAEAGGSIMIEEPEISLHPQAQVDMAELLATAAAPIEKGGQGVQILATTHSTFLLLGLTSAVQKQIIKPQDVVVYELEKDAKGTKVKKKLELNEKGVIKGWVNSFSEVEKRLFREWSKTLPKV